MDRHHGQAGVDETIDEQPVGSLERDPLDAVSAQQLDQRAQPAFIVPDGPAHERPAVLVDNADRVVVLGQSIPANARIGGPPLSRSLPAEPSRR
jgi:hypothetical protein